MKFLQYLFLTGLLPLVVIIACDSQHHEYDAESVFDSLFVGDTVLQQSTINATVVYPTGCNTFKDINYVSAGDTIFFHVYYHFAFGRDPCAHGSGIDTQYASVSLPSTGNKFFTYLKGSPYDDSLPQKIVKRVYVK